MTVESRADDGAPSASTAAGSTAAGSKASGSKASGSTAAGSTGERPDAPEQLGRAFKATLAAMRRMGARETRRPGELGYAQYGLLFGLREGGELSSSDLACAADLSPASATEMLDALVAAGLVRRLRSERDRRVVLISLTERGRTLVEERRARHEPRWRAALSEFSDEQLLCAAAVLERLRAMFDERTD